MGKASLAYCFVLWLGLCTGGAKIVGNDHSTAPCKACLWTSVRGADAAAARPVWSACSEWQRIRLRGGGTVQEESGSQANRRGSSGRTRAGRRQRLTRGAGIGDSGEEGGDRRGGGLPGAPDSGPERSDGAVAWDAAGELRRVPPEEFRDLDPGAGAATEPLSNEVACTLAATYREEARETAESSQLRVSFPLLAPTERYAGKAFGGRMGRQGGRGQGLVSGQSDAARGPAGGAAAVGGGADHEGVMSGGEWGRGVGGGGGLEQGAGWGEEEWEAAAAAAGRRRRAEAEGGEEGEGPQGPNDTVEFVAEALRELLALVEAHPSLAGGSASFMRDYLRTLIYKSAEGIGGEEEGGAGGGAAAGDGGIRARAGGCGGVEEDVDMFDALPDEAVHAILSHLDGTDLAKVMRVSERFGALGADDFLWQRLCLSVWPSLRHDPSACALLEGADAAGRPLREGSKSRWRQLYPSIADIPSWPCTLIKSGRAMCNMLVHNVAGLRLDHQALGSTLVLERRFPIGQLPDFVSMDGASILYFEPETPDDQPGYDALIEYLLSRDRVGLGVEADRRVMYIPPCEFTRTNLSYTGKALMGIVQKATLTSF